MTLHVETQGAGADLVLLHGWGMHSGVWQAVFDELSRNFKVHAVDLPGLGYSPSCEPYTLPHIAGLLADRFPQPVHVCGWSLGGQVAIHWALDRPDQIKRMILVGPTPRFVTGDDWTNGISGDVFRQFAQQVTDDYKGTLIRFLSLQAQGGEVPREQIRQLREHFFKRTEPTSEVLQAGLRILLATDLRHSISSIRQPSLLIHGSHDTLVPAVAAEWMHDQLPHAELKIMTGAAHAPFLSHPVEFVSAVQNFLESH